MLHTFPTGAAWLWIPSPFLAPAAGMEGIPRPLPSHIPKGTALVATSLPQLKLSGILPRRLPLSPAPWDPVCAFAHPPGSPLSRRFISCYFWWPQTSSGLGYPTDASALPWAVTTPPPTSEPSLGEGPLQVRLSFLRSTARGLPLAVLPFFHIFVGTCGHLYLPIPSRISCSALLSRLHLSRKWEIKVGACNLPFDFCKQEGKAGWCISRPRLWLCSLSQERWVWRRHIPLVSGGDSLRNYLHLYQHHQRGPL